MTKHSPNLFRINYLILTILWIVLFLNLLTAEETEAWVGKETSQHHLHTMKPGCLLSFTLYSKVPQYATFKPKFQIYLRRAAKIEPKNSTIQSAYSPRTVFSISDLSELKVYAGEKQVRFWSVPLYCQGLVHDRVNIPLVLNYKCT